jgi:hypothetical protein
MEHENSMKTTCIRTLLRINPTPHDRPAWLLPTVFLTSTSPTTLPSSTESKSLAGSANNSSLHMLAAEQSVLVRHAVKSASRSSVTAGTEIVVVLDGKAIFLGELRGQSVLDVHEDVAFDEGLGACRLPVSKRNFSVRCIWTGIFLDFSNSPILVLMAVSPTEPPSK